MIGALRDDSEREIANSSIAAGVPPPSIGTSTSRLA
jgi:hypothetical protein